MWVITPYITNDSKEPQRYFGFIPKISRVIHSKVNSFPSQLGNSRKIWEPVSSHPYTICMQSQFPDVSGCKKNWPTSALNFSNVGQLHLSWQTVGSLPEEYWKVQWPRLLLRTTLVAMSSLTILKGERNHSTRSHVVWTRCYMNYVHPYT